MKDIYVIEDGSSGYYACPMDGLWSVDIGKARQFWRRENAEVEADRINRLRRESGILGKAFVRIGFDTVSVGPGQAVRVPLIIPSGARKAWAEGYLQAKQDFRIYEKELPRSCDDLPSNRSDGLLSEVSPRTAEFEPCPENARLRGVLEDIARAHPSECDQCPGWAQAALEEPSLTRKGERALGRKEGAALMCGIIALGQWAKRRGLDTTPCTSFHWAPHGNCPYGTRQCGVHLRRDNRPKREVHEAHCSSAWFDPCDCKLSREADAEDAKDIALARARLAEDEVPFIEKPKE